MGAVPYFRIELIGTAMPSADEPNNANVGEHGVAEDVHNYTAFERNLTTTTSSRHSKQND
jgi:hypothetical protein